MNKTELIHDLVKVLEPLEKYRTILTFTNYYNYSDFTSFKFSCPAFDFEGYYYEIQRNGANDFKVLRWYSGTPTDIEGYILKIYEIKELINDLAISWAEYNLDNLEESRFRYENDKSLIYDSQTNQDICVCYDPVNTELLITLLNKHYE